MIKMIKMIKIIGIPFIFVFTYFFYCAIFGLFFSFLIWDISVFLEAIKIFKNIGGMGTGVIRSVSATFSIMAVIFYLTI